MSWKKVKLGEVLKESKIICDSPNPDRRIKVKLKVLGVEKRGLENEIEGATKQFIRKSGQFIYGKQNFHKGAFGIIPDELDGFESSADLPAFDVAETCLPEWIFYFFKQGNYYLELAKIARGVATQRIHPDQIYEIEIPLPDLEVQKYILSNLKLYENIGAGIFSELTHQLTLVKKLRQQLLQDAVQGKLVPQDPNDEPASELLKKIKAEKQKLITEGKLKKEKELPPIKPEEIPFEIPESWVWCRLGEISYIASGSTPSQDAFVSNGIPYLKMYNLKNQEIAFDYKPQFIKEEIHNGQLKRSRTQVGDLIMNIVGPPLGKLAIIPDTLPEANFNQAGVLIRPYLFKEINKWIFYYLNEMSEINSISTKGVAGQDNISITQSNNMKIPLPPLSEQHLIVQELEQLMQNCNALEESIKQSATQNERLLQQVLREALRKEENVQIVD
ncbi:MAG: restriction endonuclease subunit S [Bacteroidales bacterium]|nr:restriction endonuclease subunit S [Bacteroidales bacterium]